MSAFALFRCQTFDSSKQCLAHASSHACAVSCQLKKCAIIAKKFNWREFERISMCCSDWEYYAVTSHSPQVKTKCDIIPPSLWIYLHQIQKNSIECILKPATEWARRKVISYYLPSFWIFLYSIQKNSIERHMFLVPQLSYVVTVLFRRVSQTRIRWLLNFSFESAALIHHIMMLAHSSAAHRMRSQDYLLWVGCCMSLAELSWHMNTMTLSGSSESQRWYGWRADVSGLRWCCVRRR